MKFFAILLSGLLLSCTSGQFEGFGPLTIGSDFNVIPNHGDFESYADDENFISSYTLPEIGAVSHVNVTTRAGKICQVKFRTTPQTNVKSLQSQLAQLQRLNLDSGLKNAPATKVQAYVGGVDSIMVAIIPKTHLKSGFSPEEIVYQDKQALLDVTAKMRAGKAP